MPRGANTPTPSGGEVDKPLKLCPWLKSVPSRLLERLTWAKAPTAALQGKDILLLYEGLKDGDALDETLAQLQPDLAQKTLAIDIRRKPEAHPNHILDDGFYSTLCCAAVEGRWAFVGGGPNCRTWSILRWFPKPGAPRPVRGRANQTPWRNNLIRTGTVFSCSDKWC